MARAPHPHPNPNPHRDQGGGARIRVREAPEPSDVFWANLELSELERACWTLANTTILLLLASVSATALITAAFYADSAKQQLGREREQAEEDEQFSIRAKIGLLSLCASGVSVVTNSMMSEVALHLSSKAGPTSRTRFETNVFAMLAFFFLVNTSVTPFVVSTLEAIRTRHMTMGANLLDPRTKGKNQLVYQVWFDSGGMVENMFYALLGSTGSFAIAQLLPAVTVLKRYVLSLTADSQHRLNELWTPPAMDVGKNYAKLLKAVSLTIIYAPLYPPLYLLAIVYLLVSFYASKFGIAHWFAHPNPNPNPNADPNPNPDQVRTAAEDERHALGDDAHLARLHGRHLARVQALRHVPSRSLTPPPPLRPRVGRLHAPLRGARQDDPERGGPRPTRHRGRRVGRQRGRPRPAHVRVPEAPP